MYILRDLYYIDDNAKSHGIKTAFELCGCFFPKRRVAGFGIGQAPELGKDRSLYEQQVEGHKKGF